MSEANPTSSAASGEQPEHTWTYRGYKMSPGEFNTAMVHFYRGEITRSNVWRTRLDSTTNWAVVTAGAVLTFAFGSIRGDTHVVILLSLLFVWLFLFIEARRYRYYELWALRVRLMETDFFAAMLNPPSGPHREWAVRLIDSLLTPEFPISFLEALGRRLRRNYIWLFVILGIAWVTKLMLQINPPYSFGAFLNQATIGLIPGNIVVFVVIFFFIIIISMALLTVGLQESPGEVLPHTEVFELSGALLHDLAGAASQVLPEEIPFLHRHEHLVIIITDMPEEVSERLLTLFRRGVTSLPGKGMYSGEPRGVLLCVVTSAEVNNLKTAVYDIDENAFVVVNTTEEALGAGFRDLEPRWKRALRRRRARAKTKVSRQPQPEE